MAQNILDSSDQNNTFEPRTGPAIAAIATERIFGSKSTLSEPALCGPSEPWTTKRA